LILEKDPPQKPVTQNTISSFDSGTKLICQTLRPDRYRHLNELGTSSHQISRGAGLSLSPASFGHGSVSVSLEKFNRILDFDSCSGEVEVEAGIKVFEVHNFLTSKGLFLPILPGHGQISIGGCIAADIHGKNQLKDGNFFEQVISLKLFHPSFGILESSREVNADVFFLTCGGYGLTGHILSVKLRAQKLPTNVVITKTQGFINLNAGLQLLNEVANHADFTHSWHDFSTPGINFGSGMVFESNFERIEGNENSITKINPVIPKFLRIGSQVPVNKFILNRKSIKLMNAVYRRMNPSDMEGKNVDLADSMFPIHKLQTYYTFLGKRGFHEYQVILPKNVAANFLEEMATIASNLHIPFTLASGKVFGGSEKFLRFSGSGICFAVNFPRGSNANKLLEWLDTHLVINGGKPNLIKDSRLPRVVVEACYPEIDEFRAQLRSFDAKRLFRSDLSARLGL
jgi:decaprenylphospho-beta-D-ribofuranose 2-oxidase